MLSFRDHFSKGSGKVTSEYGDTDALTKWGKWFNSVPEVCAGGQDDDISSSQKGHFPGLTVSAFVGSKVELHGK
jgi:hypothetical protein